MDSDYIHRNGIEKFGRFYGTYSGMVQDVEDPLGLNRLLLYIPEVMGPTGDLTWALAKGSFSGANYGAQAIPSIGDMVWVTYRHGHPRHALWEHGAFGVDEKPEDFKELDTFGFITPRGTKVLLKDSDNTILVSTPEGNSISIIEDGAKIVFKNKENISISIEGKKVKVNNQYLTIGDELKDILEELQEHLSAYSTAILGATGVPVIGTSSPTPDIGLVEWRDKLKEFLTNYT